MWLLTLEQSIFMIYFFNPFPKNWAFGITTYPVLPYGKDLSRNSICRLHELLFPLKQMELRICYLIWWQWLFNRHAQNHWSVCPSLVCIATLFNLHQLKNAWFGYWRIIKGCKSPRASRNDIWLEWWLRHEGSISIWIVWLIYKIITTFLQEEWH